MNNAPRIYRTHRQHCNKLYSEDFLIITSILMSALIQYLQIMAPTATTNRQENTNPSKSSLHTAPLIINGQDVITTATFPAASPATGHLYQAGSASKADAVSAVEAAQGPFLS